MPEQTTHDNIRGKENEINEDRQPASKVTRMLDPLVDLSESARERARLRAEYFASHAAAAVKVLEFRRRVVAEALLRGRSTQASAGSATSIDAEGDPEYATVSQEAGRRFLASPAVAVMTT